MISKGCLMQNREADTGNYLFRVLNIEDGKLILQSGEWQKGKNYNAETVEFSNI